jgi:carbon starvation protein
MWPFLFVMIACGAMSGFHSLVGSGTTSKQISNEEHACTIGYGGMLMEGVLAVLVIIAVSAGFGMATEHGLTGAELWTKHYTTGVLAGKVRPGGDEVA